MIDGAIRLLILEYTTAAVHPSTEIKPLTSNLPRVIYTQIDAQRRYCDDGNIGVIPAHYQLDIFADKVTEARAIADAIRIGLDGYRGVSDGVSILRIHFPSESFTKGEKAEGANKAPARMSQDIVVTYREQV